MKIKKWLIILMNFSIVILAVNSIFKIFTTSSINSKISTNDIAAAQNTLHKNILSKYNGDTNAIIAEINRLIQKNTLCSLVKAENLSGQASTDSDSEVDQKILKLNKLAGHKKQILIDNVRKIVTTQVKDAEIHYKYAQTVLSSNDIDLLCLERQRMIVFRDLTGDTKFNDLIVSIDNRVDVLEKSLNPIDAELQFPSAHIILKILKTNSFKGVERNGENGFILKFSTPQYSASPTANVKVILIDNFKGLTTLNLDIESAGFKKMDLTATTLGVPQKTKFGKFNLYSWTTPTFGSAIYYYLQDPLNQSKALKIGPISSTVAGNIQIDWLHTSWTETSK